MRLDFYKVFDRAYKTAARSCSGPLDFELFLRYNIDNLMKGENKYGKKINTGAERKKAGMAGNKQN